MKHVIFWGAEVSDYIVFSEAILDDNFNFKEWVSLDLVKDGNYLNSKDFPDEVVRQVEDEVTLFAQDEAGMDCVEDITEDEADELVDTGVLRK